MEGKQEHSFCRITRPGPTEGWRQVLEYQELVRESSSGLAKARPTVDSRPLLHFPSQPWPGLETEVDQMVSNQGGLLEEDGPRPRFSSQVAPPCPPGAKGPSRPRPVVIEREETPRLSLFLWMMC